MRDPFTCIGDNRGHAYHCILERDKRSQEENYIKLILFLYFMGKVLKPLSNNSEVCYNIIRN